MVISMAHNHEPNGSADERKLLNAVNESSSSNAETPLLEKPSFKTKLYVWKDILIVAFAGFSYLFGTGTYVFNLSTLYDDANLVFTALAVYSAAQMVTSLFLPTLLIRKFGCKTVLMMATFSPILFCVGPYYPSHWTFVPGAVAFGFGVICSRVATGTYLSSLGQQYADSKGSKSDGVIGRFFGVVYLINLTGVVFGNLIMYSIVKSASEKSNNGTEIPSYTCGRDYCNNDQDEDFSTPNYREYNQSEPEESSSSTPSVTLDYERKVFSWVVFSVAILGTLVTGFFLNPRKDLEEARCRKSKQTTIPQLLVANFVAMKDARLVLLIMTFVFSGMIRSFAGGDFPKGYVLCSVGLESVSLLGSITNFFYAIFTLVGGYLIKYIGIACLMTFTNAGTLVVLVFLIVWIPHSEGFLVLAIVDSWMGFSMGMYNTLLNTKVGVLFPEKREASYALFRFFFAFGGLMNYALATSLCMYVKLAALLFLLGLACITYFILECLLRQKRNENVTEQIESSLVEDFTHSLEAEAALSFSAKH